MTTTVVGALSFNRRHEWRRAMAAAVCLLSMFVDPVFAEALPDAHAPAHQKAVVNLHGSVPVVRIAAPDGAGLSHNKWSAFDVPVQGMVLNNAVAGAESALAGTLGANVALNGSPASIVLNEVTGNRPSLMLGRLEVAGQAARVIVANPNGITCNGCGFINTPHVQLTTGRIERIRDALRFDVTGGRIDIGTSGLSALATRIDLIAQTLRGRGPIDTRSGLVLMAGRFAVDADTLAVIDPGHPDVPLDPGPDAGVFPIDIGQSVAAGSIQLIAVGDELGVRTTAPMQALQDVLVSTRQTVELRGDVSAGRNVVIHNIGALDSVVNAAIDAGRDVDLLGTVMSVGSAGRIKAAGDIVLGFIGDNSDGWSHFRNQGLIDAGADLTFAGPGEGFNLGVIRAVRSIEAAGGHADRASGDTALPGSHSVRAVEEGGVALRNMGVLQAGLDLHLNLIDNDGGHASAGRDAFVWQSQRGRRAESGPSPSGKDGLLSAGRDLFLFAPAERDDIPGPSSRQHFDAARDLYLVEEPDILGTRTDLRVFLTGGRTGAGGTPDQPYINRDLLAAGNDILVFLPVSFDNLAVIDAGRDLRVSARHIANRTRVDSHHELFGYERFDGCRTEYDGVCAADIEVPAAGAFMTAGRDLIADTPEFRNQGASLLAGRDIDIVTRSFGNEDRIYRALWTASYYLVNLDTRFGGSHCTSDCASEIDWLRTRTGTLELGTLPGIVQAGSRFSVGPGPRAALPPTGMVPVGPSPSPGGSVTVPSLSEALAGLLSGGAGSVDHVPSALSSFVNTGNIHANSIVVRADDIRNGFDVVRDYYHRTALPARPPALIDLVDTASYPVTTARALIAGDYSGAALMRILPPSLASSLPFVMTPEQEQAALRDALLATTHRGWILPGLAWDPLTGQSPQQQQHAILAANGAAFAIEHGIAMGTPLDDTLQSRLVAPMLWYVERNGHLHPQVHLPAEWQSQLTIVPGGAMDAELSITLVAPQIDNTGFVLSDGSLSLTADALRNRKRSAYFYEKRHVRGGTLTIEGDTVQPGGFMQAAAWDLNVGEVHSVSGEFRVLGETIDHTAALSRTFEAELAAGLGDGFTYEVARDNLRVHFSKRFGFGGLMGVVAGMTASMLIGPEVSGLMGSIAGNYGSTWAAASATASAGLANAMSSAALTQMVSGSVGQLVSTGRLDAETALASGLAGGFSAGAAVWANANVEDTFQRFSIRALTAGGVGGLTGAGFDAALLNSVINEASALGANQIGRGNFGAQGSLGHMLAHGVLGALTATARGQDAYSGAMGAITATLVEEPLDRVIGLQGTNRDVALTALSMIAGGTVTAAAGGDAVAAGWAAQNATLNNYLTREQAGDRDTALAACRTAACRAGVLLRYAGISGAQDAGILIGIGGGIGYQSYEQVEALIGLIEHLPETLVALRSIVTDGDFRAQVGHAIVSDYEQRINNLAAAYESGNWDGSITAGVEAGRLAVDVIGAGYAVAGAGKLAGQVARAGVDLSEQSFAAFGKKTSYRPPELSPVKAANSTGIGKTLGQYSAIEPGPLADNLAGTFSGGRYTVVELTNDLVLHRAGEAGSPLGQFFSLEPLNGVIQTRIDKAVLPVWPGGATSPIDTAFQVKIPAGTSVYVGNVGSQGSHYVGGTQQIVVPKPWMIQGVEVVGSSPLK